MLELCPRAASADPFGPPDDDDEFETNPIEAVELLSDVPPPTFSYARYPYAEGAPGYHLVADGGWGGDAKRAAVAASAEGGYLYGRRGRTSFNLLILGGQRFGLRLRYDAFLDGATESGAVDHLHFVTVTGGYQLVGERYAVRFSPVLQLMNDPKSFENGGWSPGGGVSVETDVYPL